MKLRLRIFLQTLIRTGGYNMLSTFHSILNMCRIKKVFGNNSFISKKKKKTEN